MGVLAAGEDLVIAFLADPHGPEVARQCLRHAAGAEAADEGVVGALHDAPDAGLRPVDRLQSDPGAGRRPRVADERAVDGMRIGTGKGHARRPRDGGAQQLCIGASRQRRSARRADRRESRVRMDPHRRKREGRRDAGDDLIGHRKPRQQLRERQLAGLALGEKGRQNIGTGVAGNRPQAFVELAPGGCQPVGHGRRDTIETTDAGRKHRRLRRGRRLGKAQHRFTHLWLGGGRGHRRDVVCQYQGGPAPHFGRKALVRRATCPFEQLSCRPGAGGALGFVDDRLHQNHSHRSGFSCRSAALPR